MKSLGGNRGVLCSFHVELISCVLYLVSCVLYLVFCVLIRS